MIMATYYDFLLAAIPSVMLGVPAFLTFAGIPFMTGITLGAAIAGGFMIHGLFVRSPADDPLSQNAPHKTTSVPEPETQSVTESQLDTHNANTVAPRNGA